jgi:hypothetical protein
VCRPLHRAACSLLTGGVSVSIERCGRVVNTPALYSGTPGSNLGLETGYPEGFGGFPQSLHENAGNILN